MIHRRGLVSGGGSALAPKSWVTVPFGNYYREVEWMGGRFVTSYTTASSVGANTTYTAASSVDGITWATNTSLPAAAGNRPVKGFYNVPGTQTGYALASAISGSGYESAGAFFLKTTDGGATWANTLWTPAGSYGERVTYQNGLLFILLSSATSGDPSRVGASADGVNWSWATLDNNTATASSTRFSYTISVAYDSGVYMALTYKLSLRNDFNGYDGEFKTYTSTDGYNWTFSNELNNSQLGNISQTYFAQAELFSNGGKFIAIRNAESFNRIAYAPSATRTPWTSGSIANVGYGSTYQTLRIKRVAGGFLMCVGIPSGDLLYKSTDGINWSQLTPHPNIGANIITGFAVSGNKIVVAAGSNFYVGEY